MGLELYSQIEQELGFEDEIAKLHYEILNLVKKQNPNSLIDIGCGQGSFLQSLECTNIKGFGIDLSQNQINVAIAKNLNVACQDIAEVDAKFDCATAIFDVVNYIHSTDLEGFFHNIYNKLNDNGVFIFDVNTKFGFEDVAQGSMILDKEDRFIAIDAVFENNILTTNIITFDKIDTTYSKHQDSITQFFHTKEQILKTAKSAGFTGLKSIGFKLHSNTNDDKNIWILKK
jgi:cyclopropane fatty-acyl-phospholipid synthase-like methyltransferase